LTQDQLEDFQELIQNQGQIYHLAMVLVALIFHFAKRDEEDKVRVNAWQSFAASKGKVMKKAGNIVASESSKTLTSFASRRKHRFDEKRDDVE